MPASPAVVDWLLESDPAIRWQVMRDLLDAPEAAWWAERARVETRGLGRPAAGRPRTRTGNGRAAPSVPTRFDWNAVARRRASPGPPPAGRSAHLREFGLDPASRRRPRARSRWSARTAAVGRRRAAVLGGRGRGVHQRPHGRHGAYFGVDVARRSSRASSVSGSRTAAGTASGRNGSVRSLVRHHDQRARGAARIRAGDRRHAAASARRGRSGEEFLLERSLFRRLSTGEPADPRLPAAHASEPLAPRRPARARLLPRRRSSATRALARPSPMSAPAARRRHAGRSTGRCAVASGSPSTMAPGEPSRWITLRALRVLRWWDEIGTAPERRQP